MADSLLGRARVRISADLKGFKTDADRQIQRDSRAIGSAAGLTLGQAMAQSAQRALGRSKFDVNVDTTRADSKIAAVGRRLSDFARRSVRAVVDVDTTRAVASLTRLRDSIDGLSLNKFTGRVGAAVAGLAAIAPAILPIAGAAVAGGAALGGMGIAAVAAGGVGALAFRGVGDAIGEIVKLRPELDRLPDSAQRFAQFIADRVLPGVQELRTVAADNLFPGLTRGIEALLPSLPSFSGFVGSLAAAMGRLAESAGAALGGPEWQPFFDYIGTTAVPFVTNLGRQIGNLALGFANMLVAFAPVSGQIVSGLGDMSLRFADFGKSPEFKAFVQFIVDNMPRVRELFASIGGAIGNLVESMLPFAPLVIEIATAAFRFIESLPPAVLSGITLAVIGLVVAFGTLSPVMGVIITAVTAIASGVPVMGAVLAALGGPVTLVIAGILALGAGLVAAYHHSETFRDVVNGAITAVRDVAVNVWENFLRPVFSAIGAAFEGVGNLISLVYTTKIEPILQKFGAYISDKLAPVFEAGVDLIASAWNRIEGIAKKPIKFVVETVIRDGLVKNYNKVAEFFDAGNKANTRIDPEKFTLPAGFASGGYTGPGEKYKPAGIVHAGEYVFTKEETQRAGVANLKALSNTLRGYADGGLVTLLNMGRQLRGMGYTVSENKLLGDNPRPGAHSAGGYHYKYDNSGAFDLNANNLPGGETAAINRVVGIIRAAGLNLIWQSKDHYDHAHVDVRGGGGGGKGGDSGGGLFDVAGAISGALSGVLSQIGDSPFAQMVSLVPKKLIGMAVEKAKSLIGLGNEGAETVTGKVGPGVEQWRDEVLRALQIVNQPANLADVVLRRMNQESGGNPLAVNNWDINARRGTPSRGLMQTIPGTFSRYRDPSLPNSITDPMANIVASMRYALDRYGSLPAAYNRKGGYAQGVWDLPRDQVAQIHRGEMIVPARQAEAFRETMRRESGVSSGSGPLIENLTITTTDSTKDALDETLFHIRRARRGGVYSR